MRSVPQREDVVAEGNGEAEDPLARAMRAMRQLEAAKARLQRQSQQIYDTTREQLVVKLLPVLDNLERSIAAAHGGSDKALLEGTMLVRDQMETVLRHYGLERVESKGLAFDPNEHDAIAVEHVSDPQLEGIVVRQLQPGYRFGGRLIRPARVTVAKLV